MINAVVNVLAKVGRFCMPDSLETALIQETAIDNPSDIGAASVVTESIGNNKVAFGLPIQTIMTDAPVLIA